MKNTLIISLIFITFTCNAQLNKPMKFDRPKPSGKFWTPEKKNVVENGTNYLILAGYIAEGLAITYCIYNSGQNPGRYNQLIIKNNLGVIGIAIFDISINKLFFPKWNKKNPIIPKQLNIMN